MPVRFKLRPFDEWPSSCAPSVVKDKLKKGLKIERLRINFNDGTMTEFVPADRRNTARSQGRGGPPPANTFEEGDEIDVADNDAAALRRMRVDPRFEEVV